mmetsp:Transcript_110106/g.350769  ORF Transcript_110106/g.350769 Transcript_110106/m.350769 type:complete len:284 (-) Transcript_110106:4987-5838(-)
MAVSEAGAASLGNPVAAESSGTPERARRSCTTSGGTEACWSESAAALAPCCKRANGSNSNAAPRAFRSAGEEPVAAQETRLRASLSNALPATSGHANKATKWAAAARAACSDEASTIPLASSPTSAPRSRAAPAARHAIVSKVGGSALARVELGFVALRTPPAPAKASQAFFNSRPDAICSRSSLLAAGEACVMRVAPSKSAEPMAAKASSPPAAPEGLAPASSKMSTPWSSPFTAANIKGLCPVLSVAYTEARALKRSGITAACRAAKAACKVPRPESLSTT